MIPHLDSLLEMNRRGEMPMNELVSHIVKSIALQGNKSDYLDLPTDLQDEVAKQLARYRETGGWFVVSNDGMENYGDYADKFLEKVGEF